MGNCDGCVCEFDFRKKKADGERQGYQQINSQGALKKNPSTHFF